MGKFFSLVSLTEPSERYNRRKTIPETVKREVLIRSKGICECRLRGCKKKLISEETEFHHWNGNPADNRPKNIAAVRSDCHKILTARQMKKRKKRRRRKEAIHMDDYKLLNIVAIVFMPIYRFFMQDYITAVLMCGLMVDWGCFATWLGIIKTNPLAKKGGKIFVAIGFAMLIIVGRFLRLC